MKELKVGERVSITLEAVEQKTCKGCFFDNYGCNASDMFKCGYANRSDGKGLLPMQKSAGQKCSSTSRLVLLKISTLLIIKHIVHSHA